MSYYQRKAAAKKLLNYVKKTREGTYVYLWLIYADVQQKLTQYYKAIILQLKKKEDTKPYIMGPLLAKDGTKE